MVHIWYYKEIDRFAASKTPNRPDIEVVRSSALYNSGDYYRYIPLEGFSLTEIDEVLCNTPREACFELTKACNLVCPVCIAGSTSNDPSSLSYEGFSSSLKKLHPTIKRITLTGGEPTLLSDLFKFVHTASSNFEGVIIATNGLWPREIERAIKGLKGLTVTVSLQGNKEAHDNFTGVPGAFDSAFETVQRCLDLGHRVEVLTTAFVEAIQTLPELASQLAALPIGEHRINMVKRVGRILRFPAKFESIQKAITEANPKYKMTIKRVNQPFLFIASNGTQELRDGHES